MAAIVEVVDRYRYVGLQEVIHSWTQAHFPVLSELSAQPAGLPVARGPSREAYVAIGTYTFLRSSLTHPALYHGQRFLSETQWRILAR